MAANFPGGSDFNLDLGRVIPPQLGRNLKWGFLIIGLIVLYVALNFLRSIYTDWLWFGQLGFRSVYVTVLVTRVVLFIAGASLFGILIGIALYFANRISRGPEEVPLPQATRDVLKKIISWGTVAVAIVLSAVFGTIAAGHWEIVLRFSNAASFATAEPVFGRDVSFYVFQLPVLEAAQGWLLGAGIAIMLATVGMFFVNFSFRGVGFLLAPGVKAQVSVIASGILLIVALGHWLDRWGLPLSDRGLGREFISGALYADVNARSLALLVMTIVALAAAVLVLVNGYMKGIRLLIGGVALWGVMAIVLGSVWPAAVQRLTVNPNEFTKERPYIERNIEFTRRAFGLEGIAERPYPAVPTLTADLVRANPETIDNIRLWDHNPLSDVYRQIQLIRPYYDFLDADVDRYVVDGQYRQVMLAAREVASDKLEEGSQKWINKRLRYTHGFGVAMSPVTEFTADGRPEFFAKDIPKGGQIPIQAAPAVNEPETVIRNPRIYYGENTTEYVIVNTNTNELDYQAGEDEIAETKYFGTGGVHLGSFINRLAYAWQLGDINVLISAEITGDSRIQYRREIQERISTVAPFLRLDRDPYIVAAEEGLFWIQDAYTVSDRYPYSNPSPEGFNYIRNSVKIVVDAFNGTLRFYVWDAEDPLIRTYQSIFPKLFLPKEAMQPLSLREHVRYPQDLFDFQADKYLRYHMLDPQDFYNLEDIWGIPDEKFGQSAELQAVAPYYAIMKIPGEAQPEFVLLLPLTRNDPPIMAGWIAARNDGDNYGKLVSFFFPKDRQLDSPRQIEAKIDNNPDISEWLTLRCQEGSECIRGNLLVLPISAGEVFSLLYAEPIYLQAEGVEFPELKQVILASQEKVVMEGSVREAIAALTGSTIPAPAAVDAEAPAKETTLPEDQLQTGIDTLSDALNGLKESLAGLESALQSLKSALQSLKELTGEQ